MFGADIVALILVQLSWRCSLCTNLDFSWSQSSIIFNSWLSFTWMRMVSLLFPTQQLQSIKVSICNDMWWKVCVWLPFLLELSLACASYYQSCTVSIQVFHWLVAACIVVESDNLRTEPTACQLFYLLGLMLSILSFNLQILMIQWVFASLNISICIHNRIYVHPWSQINWVLLIELLYIRRWPQFKLSRVIILPFELRFLSIICSLTSR